MNLRGHTAGVFSYLSVLVTYVVLNSLLTSANVVSSTTTSERPRRPIAEVDPDVTTFRTRGFTQGRTTESAGSEDSSLWNFSSSYDRSGTDQTREEEQSPSLEEIVLRLSEEEALEEMGMEGDLLRDALAARRSRPSSRKAPPRKKNKTKKQKRNRNMYAPLSNKQEERMLAMHNAFRRMVPGPASNMEEMVWDDELRLMAKKYAKKCIWEHGQAMESTTFKHVGQNMAFGAHSRAVMTPFYLTTLWYQENENYNITTNKCKPNTMCGHYTQMVWSDTNRVGCATQMCRELVLPHSTMTIENALLLICNYGPGGNFVGRKPYDIGKPCTRCASGSGKCNDGLCSDCDLSESTCECALECQNGGTLDEANCRCTCPPGWRGQSCESVCNNTHEWCGNGWPKSWCFDDSDSNAVEDLCPAMCGVCECGGPACQNGGTKSDITCQCECPAPWGGDDCSACSIKCVHGTMDDETCSCTCDDGWTGMTCSETCEDKHDLCNKGWFSPWCTEEYPYVLDNCPAMCGLCKVSINGVVRAGNCRTTCNNGGTLRGMECECDCAPGFYGDDCSLKCQDKSPHCSWATSQCGNSDYVKHYCPLSCQLCTRAMDVTD
ncbi:uncharacterized protein [Diadema setosum]|uniref:uncharacterized protein n=1 Tax=Diadema setosum TaxID=31175 RepID=UPI003B3A7FC6